MKSYKVTIVETRRYRMTTDAESVEDAEQTVWDMIEDGAEPEDIAECIAAYVDDVEAHEVVA